jgi:5'-methylthioadenosine phosphorylase
VTVEAVVANLMKNVATAKEVLRHAIPRVPDSCAQGCPEALKNAVITAPKAFPPRVRKRLALLLDRDFPPRPRSRRRG